MILSGFAVHLKSQVRLTRSWSEAILDSHFEFLVPHRKPMIQGPLTPSNDPILVTQIQFFLVTFDTHDIEAAFQYSDGTFLLGLLQRLFAFPEFPFAGFPRFAGHRRGPEVKEIVEVLYMESLVAGRGLVMIFFIDCTGATFMFVFVDGVVDFRGRWLWLPLRMIDGAVIRM